MDDSMDDFYGEVRVREVVGGTVAGNPRGDMGARLDALEADLERLDGSFASLEAAHARVREAQAEDAAREERRYRELLRRPRAAGPDVGKVWGDAIFGTPVRESSVHPLGRVISGAHSHGSVRHTHDRLPGDHLHCMHCGGDSRLCLENPHHAEGATPARESKAASEGNPSIEGVELLFEGAPTRPMRYEDIAALEQMAQQSRAAIEAKRPARQPSAQDRRIVAAVEHTMHHGGLRL
jgi:hypothetical protein